VTKQKTLEEIIEEEQLRTITANPNAGEIVIRVKDLKSQILTWVKESVIGEDEVCKSGKCQDDRFNFCGRSCNWANSRNEVRSEQRKKLDQLLVGGGVTRED
jgi:hypothetical protein